MNQRPLRVRIHGREGQHVTTSARLIAAAARRDGLTAEATPCYGREMNGAPVEANCQIGNGRNAPVSADCVDVLIIRDPALLHFPDVVRGLDVDGHVLVRARSLEHLGVGHLIRTLPPGHVCAVPADHNAAAALLGAFVGVTDAVTVESLISVIREHFDDERAETWEAAARRAYAETARVPLSTAS